MIEEYLSACKKTGERPAEVLAAALGGDDINRNCFRLSGLSLVRALLVNQKRPVLHHLCIWALARGVQTSLRVPDAALPSSSPHSHCRPILQYTA